MSLIWMLAITGSAFLLYSVKDEVRTLHDQIAEKKLELEQETESLNVIAAEWEYLNRPERLRQLSAKYLASSSTMVEQIAVVEAIPFPEHLEASSAPKKNLQVRPVQYRTETGNMQ
ncbi:MAG: hypothetical protein AB7F82_00840 [Alphaproteobacteria bacterium]